MHILKVILRFFSESEYKKPVPAVTYSADTAQQQYNTILAAFILTLVAYWSILCSDFLYLDDGMRNLNHHAFNFELHGRPLADILYKMLTNGIFVNFSPLSQILALSAMIWGSRELYRIFSPPSEKHGALSFPLLVTILLFAVFPLNFGIIAFRFDSFIFGAAILAAILAFVRTARIADRSGILPCLVPASLLTISMLIYQAMIGLWCCCACFFLVHAILNNADIKKLINHVFVFFKVLFLAALLYLPEYIYASMHMQAGYVRDHAAISLKFWRPLKIFLARYLDYIGWNMQTFVLICLGLLFIIIVVQHKIPLIRKIMALILVCFAPFAGIGFQIILADPVCMARTTTMPLAACVTCLLLLILFHANQYLIKRTALVLAAYFVLISAAFLATLGNAFHDQNEYENEICFTGIVENITELKKNHGMQHILICNHGAPECMQMNFLKQKYAFLKYDYITWVPYQALRATLYLSVSVEFVQPDAEIVHNADKLETVVARGIYVIKKTEDGKYLMIIN